MPRIVVDMVEVYVFRQTPAGPQFLVLRRSPGERLGGTWHAAYGRSHEGEKAWQAALRELREETGLAPLRFYQVDSVNTFYVAAEDTIYHNPCFAADAPADAAVELNAEHDAYEWLDPAPAAARCLWPGQRRIMQEILTEIITPGPAAAHLRIAL
jgi:dihydroneopterin triphosphate diphosphatase